MNYLAVIDKLRQVTIARGATETEERAAALKIGQLLMAHMELVVEEKQKQPGITDSWNVYSGDSDPFGLSRGRPSKSGGHWNTWIRAHAKTYEE